MGRPRRQIYSDRVYEICMRTRQGLPFACRRYMKMILKSVLARVQRDNKVVLCHYLWMGNHPHIIIVAKDKKACTQFYGEVQKQLTEAVKRLMGLNYLNLWKNNATSVIPYYDIDTVCYRIAYLYANPAKANLVDTIKDYPGLSSWREYNRDKSSLIVKYEEACPWVRAPMISKLPENRSITALEDIKLCKKWKKESLESHTLKLQPNIWMKCFKVEDEAKVKAVNEQISKQHIGLEQEARENRKNRKVMGKKKLQEKVPELSYKSNKKLRRIFAYSLDPQLRIELIRLYDAFCQKCVECYEQWKLGYLAVAWPAGALLPPLPHLANDFTPEINNVY